MTAEMPAVDQKMILIMIDDERVAYRLESSVGMQQQVAEDISPSMHNATICNLQSTVDVQLGPYVLSETWKDTGNKKMSKVTNTKLGEYSIGMPGVITMTHSYAR